MDYRDVEMEDAGGHDAVDEGNDCYERKRADMNTVGCYE